MGVSLLCGNLIITTVGNYQNPWMDKISKMGNNHNTWMDKISPLSTNQSPWIEKIQHVRDLLHDREPNAKDILTQLSLPDNFTFDDLTAALHRISSNSDHIRDVFDKDDFFANIHNQLEDSTGDDKDCSYCVTIWAPGVLTSISYSLSYTTMLIL